MKTRSGVEHAWDILDEIASRGTIRTKAKSKPGTEGYYGSAYNELRGPARKLFADNGQNWGKPVVVLDTEHDDRDPSVACLKDGMLLLTWFTPRHNPLVNDYWICDEGRMSYKQIGAPDRMSYSVIGAPVNLASQIEGVTKAYGSSILICGETGTRGSLG